MICGERGQLLREGEIVLCDRCLEALCGALRKSFLATAAKSPAKGLKSPCCYGKINC